MCPLLQHHPQLTQLPHLLRLHPPTLARDLAHPPMPAPHLRNILAFLLFLLHERQDPVRVRGAVEYEAIHRPFSCEDPR